MFMRTIAVALALLAPAVPAQAAPAAAPEATDGIGIQESWITPRIAPLGTHTMHWHKAGASHVFVVGIDPLGPCDMEVSRSWYEQTNKEISNERRFHWVIRNNSGLESCDARVYLTSLTATASLPVRALVPGESTVLLWNLDQSHDPTPVYFVGLTPQGATATIPCELEITKVKYALTDEGKRQLQWRIQNVGDITCSATTQLAARPAAFWEPSHVTISPGFGHRFPIVAAQPDRRVFFASAYPRDNTCGIVPEINYARTQGVNRTTTITYLNEGPETCSAYLYVAYLTANL